MQTLKKLVLAAALAVTAVASNAAIVIVRPIAVRPAYVYHPVMPIVHPVIVHPVPVYHPVIVPPVCDYWHHIHGYC